MPIKAGSQGQPFFFPISFSIPVLRVSSVGWCASSTQVASKGGSTHHSRIHKEFQSYRSLNRNILNIYAILEPEMRRSQDWSWEFAPWCQLAYTWFTHNNFQVIDTLWQTTPNSSKNHNKTKLHFAHFIWSSSWKLWKKRQLRPEIPRSTCLHIYVCIHINTYMQIHHTYTYVYIHTYMHTYIHTYIHHTHIYVYAYTIAYTSIHTSMHTYIQTYIYTYIYMDTHIQITGIHIHKNIYIYIPALLSKRKECTRTQKLDQVTRFSAVFQLVVKSLKLITHLSSRHQK